MIMIPFDFLPERERTILANPQNPETTRKTQPNPISKKLTYIYTFWRKPPMTSQGFRATYNLNHRSGIFVLSKANGEGENLNQM